MYLEPQNPCPGTHRPQWRPGAPAGTRRSYRRKRPSPPRSGAACQLPHAGPCPHARRKPRHGSPCSPWRNFTCARRQPTCQRALTCSSPSANSSSSIRARQRGPGRRRHWQRSLRRLNRDIRRPPPRSAHASGRTIASTQTISTTPAKPPHHRARDSVERKCATHRIRYSAREHLSSLNAEMTALKAEDGGRRSSSQRKLCCNNRHG